MRWLHFDNRTLMFTSNRPGSIGNADLWMSVRPHAEAQFAPAVNVGKGVSTPANEHDVAILGDGKTIFLVRDGKRFYTYTNSLGVRTAVEMPNLPRDAAEIWLSLDGSRLYFQSSMGRLATAAEGR